jgi:hypothetical protein
MPFDQIAEERKSIAGKARSYRGAAHAEQIRSTL